MALFLSFFNRTFFEIESLYFLKILKSRLPFRPTHPRTARTYVRTYMYVRIVLFVMLTYTIAPLVRTICHMGVCCQTAVCWRRRANAISNATQGGRWPAPLAPRLS
jgi:hypothetical protein